jgi:hypothetical protein
MQDDFVPERHLGLWKEEGRSEWSALLTRWPPAGHPPKESPQQTSYSVRLDSGIYNSSGKLLWSPTHDLSVDCPTREEALREAVRTIDKMIENLLVIARGLEGHPDPHGGGE